MKSVLIAYYTKTGSTKKTAELIEKTLKEAGLNAEAKAVSDDLSPADYDACIIGGPVNGMQWVPQAAQFASKWAEILKTKKTVLFCLSYIYLTGGSFWKNSIAKILKPFADSTDAMETAVFGGRVEGPLPAPMRFIFGIKRDSPLDLVNHEGIAAWAKELAPRLQDGD